MRPERPSAKEECPTYSDLLPRLIGDEALAHGPALCVLTHAGLRFSNRVPHGPARCILSVKLRAAIDGRRASSDWPTTVTNALLGRDSSPGNCDPAVIRRLPTTDRIADFGYDSGRGRGHYLNSLIELTGGVLELIRAFGDGVDHASSG
jgi:hypothetical protein